MADLKVGDRVKRRIEYGMEGGTLLPAEWGTVVYIHPERRFYTVEFTFPYGKKVRKFRESYTMFGGSGPDTPPVPPESRPRGSVDQDSKGGKGKFAGSL